jgi:hypothetical protein
MQTFWSKTDDECIEGLRGDPYIVSVVVNKKGDVRARVDVFRPVRFVIDEVPVKLRVPDMGIEEQCRAEFLAKVDEAPAFAFSGDPRVSHGFGTDRLGSQPFDLFPARDDRPFARLDLDEMEAAVQRGEMTMQEYIEAVDSAGYVDPFVDACVAEEVADGRRA